MVPLEKEAWKLETDGIWKSEKDSCFIDETKCDNNEVTSWWIRYWTLYVSTFSGTLFKPWFIVKVFFLSTKQDESHDFLKYVVLFTCTEVADDNPIFKKGKDQILK